PGDSLAPSASSADRSDTIICSSRLRHRDDTELLDVWRACFEGGGISKGLSRLNILFPLVCESTSLLRHMIDELLGRCAEHIQVAYRMVSLCFSFYWDRLVSGPSECGPARGCRPRGALHITSLTGSP
ncbi:hypothetical protein KUCAC02_020392, partial [Chaenocephalus aceratus]